MKNQVLPSASYVMLSININHNMGFYVLIHVIKHDMDPNSNVNYRRKIDPMNLRKGPKDPYFHSLGLVLQTQV